MRPILLLLPHFALRCCAPRRLEVVRPIIAQSDGGAPMPPGFEHVAGETLFFSCRIAGYAKTPEEKVHVAYSVQAFDPKGVPLTEIYKNELVTDVTPAGQGVDAEDRHRSADSAAGRLRHVQDRDQGRRPDRADNAELAVPFQVRGKTVEPSDTLIVRNFQFFRGEEDTQPLDKAVYHGGDAVWAKFDITGFKYGEKNHIDVSYVTSVISPSGKVLWTQPARGGAERELLSRSATWRRRWGSHLLPNTKPGEFTIAVTVKDAVGNQTYETKQTFTVE